MIVVCVLGIVSNAISKLLLQFFYIVVDIISILRLSLYTIG